MVKFACLSRNADSFLNEVRGSPRKKRRHFYLLGPVLLDKNNILCAAAFNFPTFMHAAARFPAR
jgi:hypothetical protein